MTTIKEIEKAVTNLSPEQLAEFRAWYEEFDAALWDKQFEADVKSGKLDRVAEKAVAEYRAGKAKPL
jgi:major membrane immunogen (membrane-anchored lipoprotein)